MSLDIFGGSKLKKLSFAQHNNCLENLSVEVLNTHEINPQCRINYINLSLFTVNFTNHRRIFMNLFLTTLLIFASTQAFAKDRVIECMVRSDDQMVFSVSLQASELKDGGVILGTFNGLEIAVSKSPTSYLLNMSMIGPSPEDVYVMQAVLEPNGDAVMFLSIPNKGKRTAVGCGLER